MWLGGWTFQLDGLQREKWRASFVFTGEALCCVCTSLSSSFKSKPLRAERAYLLRLECSLDYLLEGVARGKEYPGEVMAITV